MRTARYGRRLRMLADSADKKRRARYECPKCKKNSVKREGYAIWTCRSCGAKFTGGAYSFETGPGQSSKRMLGGVKNE
ncbi:50S ribosomal protein L37ae [Candidatus Micrarchaeota archaeon]|nr:50S ribosomal protein L37ae [Candidatus Micrarchaeota archaeon]